MDESDDKPESLDRFWDPKLEVLGEFLDQLWDDGAMDLEELDGFFAALHCCPELVLPSEYLPVILGSEDALDNEELFPNLEAAELFFGLIMHHWNAVGDAFRSGDFFMPLLLEDEEGKGVREQLGPGVSARGGYAQGIVEGNSRQRGQGWVVRAHLCIGARRGSRPRAAYL